MAEMDNSASIKDMDIFSFKLDSTFDQSTVDAIRQKGGKTTHLFGKFSSLQQVSTLYYLYLFKWFRLIALWRLL